MADRPILFSAPMIRALLEGRKTQKRRLMPHQDWLAQAPSLIVGGNAIFNYAGHEEVSRARFAVGDRLWVREAWTVKRNEPCEEHERDYQDLHSPTIRYAADGEEIRHQGNKAAGHIYHGPVETKKSAIHLPRWLSRLTLIVTGVKVERLQDISEADAVAEGLYRSEPTDEDREWNRQWCEEHGGGPNDPMEGVWMAPGARRGWGMTKAQRDQDQWGPTAAFAYRCVWESIHGKGSWNKNPWVVAITFRVVKANIDQIEAAP